MNKNNKVSNFKLDSNKINIQNKINKYEDEKSDKIFELGNLVYEKVREGLIDSSLFGGICGDIKKLDLKIYNCMQEIYGLGNFKEYEVCDCGFVVKNNEKFCPQCGKKIEKEKKKILCEHCSSSIDEDSKFCVCCGFKVDNKVNLSKDDYQLFAEDDIYNPGTVENYIDDRETEGQNEISFRDDMKNLQESKEKEVQEEKEIKTEKLNDINEEDKYEDFEIDDLEKIYKDENIDEI